MPGVLMLEAMTQAGAWLVRASEDFAHSMVVLKEARNVKYSNFVAPGQTLTRDRRNHRPRRPPETTLKAQGMVEGQTKFTGRLVLERYNLADRGLGTPATDAAGDAANAGACSLCCTARMSPSERLSKTGGQSICMPPRPARSDKVRFDRVEASCSPIPYRESAKTVYFELDR